MAETISKATIASEAVKAASTSVDGMSVSRRSVDEVIRAAEYLDRKAAGKARRSPIRLQRTNSPGAI